MKLQSRPELVVLLVVSLASGLALAACDPGRVVTFENRTARTITVFEGRIESIEIEPFGEGKNTIIDYPRGTQTYEARDQFGRVLSSLTLTWDELREADWRIVFTDESTPLGPSPTPAAIATETPQP